MKVLLSIKPKYADKILSGEKKFEFRRSIFKRPGIKSVVVYATNPVGKVIGEFSVSAIIEKTIDDLWEATHKHGGIDKDAFDDYFFGRERGYAIEIGKTVKYRTPRTLSELRPGLAAPQSFAYI